LPARLAPLRQRIFSPLCGGINRPLSKNIFIRGDKSVVYKAPGVCRETRGAGGNSLFNRAGGKSRVLGAGIGEKGFLPPENPMGAFCELLGEIGAGQYASNGCSQSARKEGESILAVAAWRECFSHGLPQHDVSSSILECRQEV